MISMQRKYNCESSLLAASTLTINQEGRKAHNLADGDGVTFSVPALKSKHLHSFSTRTKCVGWQYKNGADLVLLGGGFVGIMLSLAVIRTK